mgnify:CR=1 FL=1
MKNVLVFFGGVSCEHEVSIITGVMTANCLSAKLNVYPIYIDTAGAWHTGEKLKDLSWYKTRDFSSVTSVTVNAGDNRLYAVKKGKLKEICKVDAAINCTHGLNGEDGTLAGVMRLSKIAFASPGLFSSSVSMDKYFTKLALKGIGAETLPYIKMNRINYVKKRDFASKYVLSRLNYPVIVKPANLGSSIGISVATNDDELSAALDNAFRYDEKVIVEKALVNFREINCACIKIGDKYLVSECEEPHFNGDILGFSDKYSGEKRADFPAKLTQKIRDRIRDETSYIYRKLEFNGAVRIDYLLDGDKIIVNEINSVPGSLAYYLFVDSTEKFCELLVRTVELAIEEETDRENNVYTYSSDILNLDSAKIRK